MAPLCIVYCQWFWGEISPTTFPNDFRVLKASWLHPKREDLLWQPSPLSSLQSCYGALTSWRVWKVGDDTGGTEIGRRCIISANPIQCFDAFLSHDWGTPGWMKVWALLLIFNSVPAAFVALGVCVCTCSLLMVGQLPGGWPTATISIYVSFLVILIFWQRIRNSLGCRVPTVFLDCVCIAQHDEELKKAGIQALGGFLTQSQELLILCVAQNFWTIVVQFRACLFLAAKCG